MNIRIDQATLNVTWAGNNGDLPDAVSYDSSDADLKQVASEAIRTGYIPGVDQDPRVDLSDFVVDRFPAKGDQPNRIFIRPKVPFGDGPTILRFFGAVLRSGERPSK